MKNKKKTKEQLINELAELRQRVADLENSKTKHDQEFRALAENAPDIIAQFDKELRHIYVNLAIEHATGIPRDSFIGKTNREMGMPENLITLWDKALRTVFETGQETTIEFDFPTPGGQRYFESRIAPEFAKDGSVESVLGISRNITERKRAEEALCQSERQFKSTFENAAVGMAHIGLDGRLLRVNDTFCRITGYPPEELVTKTFQEITHPDDLTADVAQAQELAEGRIPHYFMEKRYFRKDGSIVWVNLTGSVQRDDTGQPTHFIAVVEDISARKRAEEALRESEQRYPSLFENMMDGFAYCKMLFDDDGRPADFVYLDVNSAFGRLTGLENVVGKKVTEAIPGIKESHQELIEIYGRVALTGQPETFEVEFKPLGIWLSISVYSPEREYFVAVFDNITERKLAEEALRKSEEKFRLTATHSPDVVFFQDCNLRYAWMINPAPPFIEEQVIGKTDFELLSREEAVRLTEIKRRILDTGAGVRVEIPLIIGGKKYYYDAVYEPTRDHEGRTLGIFGYAHNITEYKLAEEALQQSEELFSKAFQSSPVALNIACLADGRFVDVNESFLRMFEYSREEVIGHTSTELNIYVDPNERAQIIRILLEQGTVSNYEVILRTKTRKLIRVLFSAETMSLNGQDHTISILVDITERKRAEEALRESEARFRSVLDSSRDVIYRLNVQTGRYEYISPSAETVVGFSSDELMALDIETSMAMIHPDDLPAMRAVLARLEDTGKGEMEYRQRTKNGDYCWISNHMSLVKDSAGRPLYRNGNIRDITERKQAEERLRQSEAKFRLLTESIDDSFSAVDPDLRFTYWNRAAEELTGISSDEAMGKTRLELLGDDEETRKISGYLRECMQTRKPIRYETASDLEGYVFDIKLLPTADGVSIIGRDITEIKRAEKVLQKAHEELEIRVQERTAELKEANKALLESEASYRELTESIDDLFYAMDRDLRYTYWNKTSEAITGISAKDAIGKSLYELFPDIKGTKVEQFYIDALKTQQPARLENEYLLGNKKFNFEINAYPTKAGLSVIAKDITERKMLEAHLLRAQRMESIGTLAGGIAHDLNNMLTPIMLSLQMLKEKFKDEQSQKLLTILEKNSQRGADLIKQVLSFARGIEGERNPLAAKHIINEIEKIAKETFPRDIEIKTDIPKDLFTISGDATQLHQIIMNLCVNARDAMPAGGILSISAKNFFIDENYSRMHTEAKIGSYVVVEILDTGTGIPPKILDRIFEPFFTTKEFGKGTGLGLSTALAIVKSHGGFINVYSEVGKGTKFEVYLPAIKTEMQNIDEQEPELLIGHGELVLVAEDEDSVREVTISTLEKNGYGVLTACDGVEAISSYAQNMNEIKVILMDMMMPVMDGHAGIRAIRKINPEVKIIAVSGLAEKDKLKNVADYTNAFLPKPYTAERLLKTIHEVLSAK